MLIKQKMRAQFDCLFPQKGEGCNN